MVRINNSKCTGCGLCVSVCHESCITLKDKEIQINRDYCSTCTQCIAVCPTQALTWGNNQPIPFDDNRLPSSAQLDELLKQRRTIRQFKKDKPERSILEEIVSYGAYAPTHNFCFRTIVVDDNNLLNHIDQTVFTYNKKIYKYLYRPSFIRFLIKLLVPSKEDEYLKVKPKLESSLKIGRAYLCVPPVVVFIVGEKGLPLSTESAQYVLYNINLYATTKGLGCRNLVGNQMFLNRSKTIRTLLKLSKKERIYATFGLGYPSIKFRNKVTGRRMKIQWNDQKSLTGRNGIPVI